MGSVVVPDVVNHFSSAAAGYNMYAGTHHTPQEPQTSSPYHHHQQQQHNSHSTSSSRSHTNADPSTYQARAQYQSSADTQMTDSVPRSSSAGGRSAQPQNTEHASSARSSTSTPTHGVAQQQQGTPSSRPPPSPRLRGNPAQQQQHHTPNNVNNANNPNFTYASSIASSGSSAQPSPSQTANPSIPPAPSSPNRIKVHSLSHIQSFANDTFSPLSRARSSAGRPRRDDVGPQYEISEMPVGDVIEMVAGLLTKITTTNDRQHEHIHRHIPLPESTSGLSQQTNSVLAFHGKNVPQISILSYLSRIHKYCPTTYEVFLSLLVYFDRMTERVNSGPMQTMKRGTGQPTEAAASQSAGEEKRDVNTASESMDIDANHASAPTPPPSGSLGKPAEPKGEGDHERDFSPANTDGQEADNMDLSHFFVVDSYNIHRLVIAGVTCASKFFSDIFYTNSRYAKVGGLPLPELNHLEVQFLLLNDFRLSIPLEEIQAYGTMLVEFYAREVLAQQ